jgi:hypothetical protein
VQTLISPSERAKGRVSGESHEQKERRYELNKKTARIAGLLYLMNGVTGFFGIIYVPSRLIVSGNAAATANNILASERLFRLGIVSELICDTLSEIAALMLLRGADFLSVFDKPQLEALAMLFLDLHRYGYVVGWILGLWLFPFGVLVFRSGFLPRILGVLLIAACFGYLADSLTPLLLPSYEDVVGRITRDNLVAFD